MLNYEIIIPYIEEGILGFFPYRGEGKESTLVFTKKGPRGFSGGPEEFLTCLCRFYWIDRREQQRFFRDRGLKGPCFPLLTPEDLYFPLPFQGGDGYLSLRVPRKYEERFLKVKNLPPLSEKSRREGRHAGRFVEKLMTTPGGRLRRRTRKD